MIIKLMDRKNGTIEIEKEDTDKKYYSESVLWYAIKKKLISMGYDVIKKEMVKDGHLVDDGQYYVRSRNKKKGFWIYDPNYAIKALYHDFNNGLLHLIKESY